MTLIELLVAVAIVAIIASIAVPSYSGYVTRSKRAVAKSALSLVADRQEQFFIDNKRYADDLTEIGYDSETIGVNDNGQADQDTACGTLSLTQAGQKLQSGDGTDCW